MLERFHRPPFSRAGILDRAAIERHARRLVEAFGIRAASIESPAGQLSGGNAQKLVLARALSQEPTVLLVCQPTRGVDVGAIEQVHGELLRRRDAGMAILLISTELDEVLALSDRILVLYEGRIAGERRAGEATAEELGLMMGGRHAGAGARRMMRAVLAPLVGAAVGLVVGALIIAASGADPLAAYAALARGALGGPRPLTETVLKATPLVIMGLGLVVAFRCRIWNIGGEGQYFAGALAGTVVGLLGQASLPAWLLIPLMLLAGIAGGALWAALAAWLKLAFGVNEIIATIMLNFVALYTVSYLARGPLRDPMGYLPQSARLEEVARLPTLPGSRIHLGVLIALLLVPAIYVLLWKTTAGFRLRAIGSSARVALATGINVKAGVALAFLTSGALAGLTGIIEVSALHARLKDGISGDYGFTGILVALLGRLHPVGVLLAGVFFAILTIGTQSMHSGLGLPIALSQVLQVVVILVVLVADALARRWWPGR